MQDIKELILKEMGKLVSANSIDCYVLNGLTFDTSELGRDLDLYCSSDAHKTYLIKMFKNLLSENGAKWVVEMNPLWGRRCVGVWDNYSYLELHFVDPLNSGLFDATKTFSVSGVTGPFGFLFSPWLIFVKKILFAKKAKILNREPLWSDSICDPFIKSNQEDICEQLFKYSSPIDKFVSVLLGDDNMGNLNARRRGYLSLLYRFAIGSPMVTIESLLIAVRKRIHKYFSPCVPVVVLHSNCNGNDIESRLKNDLCNVFPEIVVTEDDVSIFRLRDMMARQRLIVLLNKNPSRIWYWLNRNNYIEHEASCLVDAIKDVEAHTLEFICHMNKKWSESNYIVRTDI